uniref:Cleavage inducing molecular chaperone Jiv domain-containing protein n=1 Tax=Buteo japonicus TaxID=224669 RepID=A0A8C0BC28_9AVES
MVSSPERRKEYEIKQMAESELTRSMSEFLSRLQDDLKEAMNTMMCSKCQGKHKRFEMDRDPLSARYCAECGRLHPAEEGDFWAESSLLGLKITYFAMMDGKIYDITEWAGCQRVGINPDTHRVPYHISFGSRSSGPGGRQSPPPNTSADLQEFFTRVFQGSSGPMPGGPFPPPPTPPGAPLPAHFAYFFFKQLVTFCSYRSIYYCVHPLSINTSAYVSCAPPRGCCPAGTPVSRPGPPPPVVVLIFLPQLCLRDPRLPPSAPGTKSSLLFFYKKQSPEAGAGSALPPIS